MVLEFILAFRGAKGLAEAVSNCVGSPCNLVPGWSNRVQFEKPLTEDQLSRLRKAKAVFREVEETRQ